MKQVLIFDVDGTLTGPRRVMPEDFARFFACIIKSDLVYLVSGSDYEKLTEQLPEWILKQCEGVYCCSGNEFWRKGQLISQQQTAFPDELIERVGSLIQDSKFWIRTGNHIEKRTGSLNISVVGRNANRTERAVYEEHDAATGERQKIIDVIEAEFPEFEVHRGGQISVDISPKGWNKAQIYPEIASSHSGLPICFFGDNIREGGNDLPLGRAVLHGGGNNQIFRVEDHFETWKILQDMTFEANSIVA